jgi:carboxymethylenebutenolidase
MPTRSEQISLVVNDGTNMNAYVVRPASDGPHPGILVFQDAFGVNIPNRGIADRYASHGFVAIAPELFHRTAVGFDGDYNDFSSVMPHVRALTTDGLIADSTAAFGWLAAQREIVPTRIAAVGFCMGGRTAFIANSALPLAAAISYYGGSIAPSLLDRATTLHGPHLFFWGGQDKGIPPEQRRAVADAVRDAGKRFVDVEFSDADHGFVTAHRYQAAAAEESWALALAFLDNALGALR